VRAGTASARLGRHVAGLRYDDVPPAIIARAKDLLVHHLGLALRARAAPPGETATRVAQTTRIARELSGMGGAHTILATGESADLLEAVFANCSLLASTPMHDFLPDGTHPAIVTHPVALAVAETEHASGRELLVSIVVGYDVIGKVAKTVWSWSGEHPRRGNNVFAPLGAAATAARLFGLDDERAGHAIGHAAHASMGLVECAEFGWPIDALLARAGVMAAVMARARIAMGPTVIEGRHGLLNTFLGGVPKGLGTSLDELGQDFEIAHAMTKRYESSGYNIVPLELALQLVARDAIAPTDVREVRVSLPNERSAFDLVREEIFDGGAPLRVARTRSLRYQVAMILTDGLLDDARYDGPLDPALVAMRERVRLGFEAGRPRQYARIDVLAADGRHHVIEGERFTPPPLDWDEWLAQCGEETLPAARRARLIDVVAGLERIDDAAELVACLRADGARSAGGTS
jgi:2-methylcitrate dehydratase PrpD